MSSSLSRYLFVLLLCTPFLTCQSQQHNSPSPVKEVLAVEEPQLPSRRQLARKVYRAGKIIVIYGDEEKDAKIELKKIAKSIQNIKDSAIEVELIGSSKADETTLINNHVLLLGTFNSNHLFGKLSNKLPLTFSNTTFSFGGENYDKQQECFFLNLFPNPLAPQHAISIAYGNSLTPLINVLRLRIQQSDYRFYRQRWAYEIHRKGERFQMGQFDSNKWTIEGGVHYNFSESKKQEWKSQHIKLQTHSFQLSDQEAQDKLEELEVRHERVANFLNKQIDEQIHYTLYDRAETKGLVTGQTLQFHIAERQGQIHEVYNEIYEEIESLGLNKYLLRKHLGKAKTIGLELGLATYLTENWETKGFQFWAKKLEASNNLLSISDLLNNSTLANISDLITAPQLAAFVDFLIQRYGKENLLKNYTSWQLDPNEVTQLEKEWITHIQSYPAIKARPSSKGIPYLKGFNFAHEGYAIYNGYGSKKAEQSLKKIKSTGSNTVAIVPYSYMRDPRQARPLPLMRRAGTEDDAASVRSSYDAQQLGMYSLLKPQIWLNGSWPGDVEMSSDEEWDQWFNYYYHWILHYALLAEMYQFDQFCIGVEFVKTTKQRPQHWKELIKRVKGIFSGPVTYAANWGEEFEQIDIWDDLDFIGLNCYYPLGKEEQIDQKKLNQRFAEILKKVEKISSKHKKPIVFTEIGFRNVEGCWKNPHAEANGRSTNQDHQKRCYQAVAEGIKDKDWCKGILWWKWPSYMDYSKRNSTSFSPCDKKAENVVREMFN